MTAADNSLQAVLPILYSTARDKGYLDRHNRSFHALILNSNGAYMGDWNGYFSGDSTAIYGNAYSINLDSTYQFRTESGGADAVVKKLGSDAILLASNKTGTTAINIASLYPNNYSALTSKNFLAVMKNIDYSLNIWGHSSSNHENQGSSSKTIIPSISYTSGTGALSVICTIGSFSLGSSYGHGNGGTVTCTPYYDVYLVM